MIESPRRRATIWQYYRDPGEAGVWPVLAGKRPSHLAVAAGLTGLHLSLLGDLQRIVNFDPKIPHSAFKLSVAEEELNSSEIFGPPID